MAAPPPPPWRSAPTLRLPTGPHQASLTTSPVVDRVESSDNTHNDTAPSRQQQPRHIAQLAPDLHDDGALALHDQSLGPPLGSARSGSPSTQQQQPPYHVAAGEAGGRASVASSDAGYFRDHGVFARSAGEYRRFSLDTEDGGQEGGDRPPSSPKHMYEASKRRHQAAAAARRTVCRVLL